ncbi:MAG: NAD-dependent deacylase [Candidatus Desulforudis sp.]|nr:NAD-dependent deacylase [Desulforudis sp.]
MTTKDEIGILARLIRESDRNLALTGAGISTASGIPDFRSPGVGRWEKVNPAEVCSVEAFERDPAAFWDNNLDWWLACTRAVPNPAHHVLARLQREGLLLGVITQNIDGLHVRAGSQTWEVHGHLRTCRCVRCEERHEFSLLVDQYQAGDNPPLCPCGGVLRPDVVLFGDMLGDDFNAAAQVLSGCQLLIVVGSSLQVYPVAALPRFARKLVIINRDPTPWDGEAVLVLRGDIVGVFEALSRELGFS